ncbi:MAG TPA: alkaline phosphatase family protein [Trebonia sp.]|nr:alkaline phosphatase family protein [Trebonia sp.]
MTIEVSRRQMMAAAGGIVLGSFALPPSLRTLLDGKTPAQLAAKRSPLSAIEHVVVLMQENRSFDHYFGAMPGVRGFADKSVSSSVFYQKDTSPGNTQGYLLPFHADTHSSNAMQIPSNSHSWGPLHDCWNNGAMDSFVLTQTSATDPTLPFSDSSLSYQGAAGQYTMAYFKRDDIPFHWALADAFTICDGYHAAMLGPTWPNRLYLMTGQVDPQGGQGGPTYSNYVPSEGFSWTTYPELLTKAGVSWQIYQEIDNYGMNVMEYFDQYQNAATSSQLYQGAMRIFQPGQFEYDAMHDKLPTVSWIIPPSYQSEHPDYMPAAGADFVASKVAAIAANPDVFAKTVFILIYDENDGFFDHVTPPTAPAGTAGEFISVSNAYSPSTKISEPIGLGFRVPCIIVSPWTVGGYVCHDTFDHTSVIQFLEQVTGVVNPNISAWRRQTSGDLTSALGAVPSRRFPRLPDTTGELERAEKAAVEFPLPAIPTASQSFPAVPHGTKPVRGSAAPSTAVEV